MAVTCGYCGSTDVKVLADAFSCSNCGKQTTTEGQAVEPKVENLAPSPTDQRIMAAPPNTAPSVETYRKAITNDNDTSLGAPGPSTQEDPGPKNSLPLAAEHETPVINQLPDTPTQGIDAPSANDDKGPGQGASPREDAPGDDEAPAASQDTTEYNKEMNERVEERLGRDATLLPEEKENKAADKGDEMADQFTTTQSVGPNKVTGSYDDWSKEELYAEAQDQNIPNRGGMTKDELIEALSK